MFTIQTIIEDALRSKSSQRPKLHWYATDLGKCLSGAYWQRKGVAPDSEFDDRTLRVFEYGKMFEDWLCDLLGKNELTAGLIVRPETIYIEEYDFAVRPDLIITLPEKRILYEIKTVHSRKFWRLQKAGKPDDHYMMQTWAGMWAAGIDEGRLIYFSKDDMAIAEYEILIDSEWKEKTIEQLKILNEAWKEGRPPAPAEKGSWQVKYCSYHKTCLGTTNTHLETED